VRAGGEDDGVGREAQALPADAIGRPDDDVHGAGTRRDSLQSEDTRGTEDAASVVCIESCTQGLEGVPPVVQDAFTGGGSRLREMAPELAAELVGRVEQGDGGAPGTSRTGGGEPGWARSDDEDLGHEPSPSCAGAGWPSPLGSRSCWDSTTSPSAARRWHARTSRWSLTSTKQS
jgi:hypothetical protein